MVSSSRHVMQSHLLLLLSVVMTLSMIISCEHKEPLPPITKSQSAAVEKSDGPGITTNPFPHEKGNVIAGREVYRFETFGNEGFWTDAMRMPQGILEAKFTPIQALKAGLQSDRRSHRPRHAKSPGRRTENRSLAAKRAHAE
jgi:hypothetical protein